jgi:hypothetical protein
MHTAFKENRQVSVAVIVYGEPQRVLGKVLAASPTTEDLSEINNQLRRHFEQLGPVSVSGHVSSAVFVHRDLAVSLG